VGMEDDIRYKILKDLVGFIGDGEVTYSQLIDHFKKGDSPKDRSDASNLFAPLYMPYQAYGIFLTVTNGQQNSINQQTKFKLTGAVPKFIQGYEKNLQVEEDKRQEKESEKQDREHQKKHRELSMRIMENQISDYKSQKTITVISVMIAFLTFAWSVYDTRTKTEKIDNLIKENYSLRDTIMFYKSVKHITNNYQSPSKGTENK
jgi:hypothetical protein